MILDYYLTGKLDEVHIIYTRMVNAMKMEAEMEQLLPLKRLSFSVPANVPLEEINLKPVSYTHLDVYKRQDIRSRGVGLFFGFRTALPAPGIGAAMRTREPERQDKTVPWETFESEIGLKMR